MKIKKAGYAWLADSKRNAGRDRCSMHDHDTEMTIIVISSLASIWRHFEDPDPNPNLNDNRYFGVEIMLAVVGGRPLGGRGGGGAVIPLFTQGMSWDLNWV